MKKFRKCYVLLLAGWMLACSLAACGDSGNEQTGTGTTDGAIAVTTTSQARNDLAQPITTTESPVVTTPKPITTKAPVTTEAPLPPEPDYPSFDNLVDLADFLIQAKESGDMKPVFRYTGSRDQLWNQNYANMLCIFYYRISDYGNTGKLFQLEMTDYPGDRMLAAYRSGDRSKLTSDESLALDEAITIVDDAQQKSGSAIELELMLHDWICDNVSYDTTGTAVADPALPPRHLTAVGALLDGSVNCQGYTDVFYLLASMAGFQVDRQSGVANGINHQFNTICLDGEWYIVDVTHDDTANQADGKGISDYRYFNAGRDRCAHTWEEAHELHPISAVSGNSYYYEFPVDDSALGYRKTFDDLGEMAQSIVEQWIDYGRTEHYLMLTDQNVDWSALGDHLFPALDHTGRPFNYTIWSSAQDAHTYFLVRFQ